MVAPVRPFADSGPLVVDDLVTVFALSWGKNSWHCFGFRLLGHVALTIFRHQFDVVPGELRALRTIGRLLLPTVANRYLARDCCGAHKMLATVARGHANLSTDCAHRTAKFICHAFLFGFGRGCLLLRLASGLLRCFLRVLALRSSVVGETPRRAKSGTLRRL